MPSLPRRLVLVLLAVCSPLAAAAPPPRAEIEGLPLRIGRPRDGAEACRASRGSAAARASTREPSRASTNVEAVSYTLDLAVDLAASSMAGTCEVGIAAVDPSVSQFSLDLVGLTVSSVLEQGTTPVAFQQSGGALSITPSSPLPAGQQRTYRIAYGGTPSRGMYFESDNQGIAYTVTEPYDARYWFPCRDLPGDKADWYRGRMTAPAGYLVASNGDLVSVTQNGDGTETTEYFHDFPITTYLVSFAVSRYSTFAQATTTGTPLEHFVYPSHLQEAQYDFANVPAMVDFYATDYWPYPFPTYGMAIAPIGGGMEHQTITTLDPRFVTGQRYREGILAHELAHQWWGDMVTCAEFKDIWLNEGFATYFDALFDQDFYGEDAFRAEMAENRFVYFLYEPYEGTFPIHDPDFLWGATVYEKGSWVLHMLRQRLGATAFTDAMRTYAQAHEYDVATTADLIAAFEAASGQELDPYFSQWVYGAGYPVLRVAWRPVAGAVRVRVDQVQAITPEVGLFDVPLQLRIVTPSGDVTTNVAVSAATQTFTIPVPATPTRVMPDPDVELLHKPTGLDGIVVAPGPDAGNTAELQATTSAGTPLGPMVLPYASGWGANVAAGDLDADPTDLRDEILSGPGPGPVYGPHVRAFRADGTVISKVSFYAYGTLRYGAIPSAGDVDADGFDEIVTGAGPGEVFGPHVRGFQVDGGSVSAMAGVSFYAYGTLEHGANVAPGSIEDDPFSEIVTGAGPGVVFGPHVRGFDHDGGPGVTAIAKVNFFAFTTSSYGANVATGDLDADGRHELLAGLGPGSTFPSDVQGFDYDGVAVAALPGVSMQPFTSPFGAVVGATDEDGDGADGVVVAPGPDPASPAFVFVARMDAATSAEELYAFVAFGGTSHGGRIAGGRLDRLPGL